ncbi:aminodeoxychorismate synthase component I [Aquisalimonas asiatica]|uniref:aminodeoxychorismate synthase n=1 Tax=Aquisalimonas asiatica TaxID=406100 RepID=A0A1H8U292_9GAMM|nr:aminodeoxychorismate synthase component I [Aquisalimonas asiatica]SEO96984.1 para-aminobenzoate synthetase component 1 [Aquisalimonas asiatica]
MTDAHVAELAYPADAAAAFARLRSLAGAAWLDSGAPSHQARHDVMVALPGRELMCRDGVCWQRDGGDWRVARGDVWALIADMLGPRREPVPGLPFSGGALGCFGYDLGQADVVTPRDERPGDGVPELWLGFYDAALVLDHVQRRAYLVQRPGGEWSAACIRERLQDTVAPEPAPFRAGALSEEPGRDGYGHAFQAVHRYLRDGDCYQVNLARAFRCGFSGDPFDAYLRLRRWSPVPHGAWMTLPGGESVLSLSPERFLAVSGDRVETRPIKGTRPRASEPGRDRTLAEELAGSPKDRAENVMIVDLLRNDLGKVCRPGSVTVSQLFGVESFASVHHMVSVVEGRLVAGASATDLLRACFPGGSITGAPKKRAMEIIAELEPSRRGLYCGAIGYIGYDGAMDTSITIRTAVCADGVMTYRAGGGLVMDSDEAAEYQETRDKAHAFLKLAGEGGSGD